MEARDFVYWLNGYVEITDGQLPDARQWQVICDHARAAATGWIPIHLSFDQLTGSFAASNKASSSLNLGVHEISGC